MKRPILVAVIGYIIGILWELYIPISIVPLILVLAITYMVKSKYKKAILVSTIFIILANMQTVYLDRKYESLYNDIEKVNVVATIISNEKETSYNYQYKIKIDKINADEKYKNTYMLLNINKKDAKLKFEYGDKITFIGEYFKPSVRRNYKGFNYKEYLKTVKIYGIIKPDSNIRIISKNNENIITLLIYKIKKAITLNINETLPKETRNLCLGILLGDTDNLSDELKEKFRDSSLYHILAVSGMHISYIIVGVTFILQRSKIPKRLYKIVTIIILIFFMILTGMTPSVFRAGMMGIILICAGLFYRKSDIVTSISLSLLISLISNPFCINSIGLQLSYGGTIGIVLFEKKIEEILKIQDEKNIILKYIKQMISVSTSAQIIIFPIMLLNFNAISLTFFISNILTGFLIGIIVICGYVLIIVSLPLKNLAKCGFSIYNLILKLFLIIVTLCSRMPLAKIYVITPNVIFIVVYYLLILIIKFKFEIIKKYYKKILILLIIISTIFNLVKIIPSNLKVYFIDVGQGDSTLIITPTNKKILIDTGGSKDKESFDVGEKILIPYLLNRGVSKLDYVMISHFDADHCNGFLAVLDKIKVDKVIVSKQAEICSEYEKIMEIVRKKKIPIQEVKRGDKISFDKYVYMDILYPTKDLKFSDINSNSIVSKLIYGKTSILFTGDIEKEAEKDLLKLYQNTATLKATIIKVAHHRLKNIVNRRIYKCSET